MPVHKVMKSGRTIGYQFGKTGRVYKTPEEAERQGRAIYASGYRGTQNGPKRK